MTEGVVFWRHFEEDRREIPAMTGSWISLVLLSVLVSGLEEGIPDCDRNKEVPWYMCDGAEPAYVASGRTRTNDDLRWQTLCLGSVENEISYKNDGCFKDHSCDLMLIAHPCVTAHTGNVRLTWSFEVFANVSVPDSLEHPNPTSDRKAASDGEVSWIQMMFSKEKIESFVQDPKYLPIQEAHFVAGDPKPRLRSYFHAENETFIPVTPVPGKDEYIFKPVPERSVILRPKDGQAKSYQRIVFHTKGLVDVDFARYDPDSSRRYVVNFRSIASTLFPYVIQYRQAIRYNSTDWTFEPKGPPVTGNIIRLNQPIIILGAPHFVDTNASVPRTRYDVNGSEASRFNLLETPGLVTIVIIGVVVLFVVVLCLLCICCMCRRPASERHHSHHRHHHRDASPHHTRARYTRSEMDAGSMYMMPVGVLPSHASTYRHHSHR